MWNLKARQWSNVVSMGLRNEIRPAIFSPILSPHAEPTSWGTWYDNMVQAANSVHRSNPDLLIFLSGQYGGVDLSRVVDGGTLDPSSRVFDPQDFVGAGNKLVLDLHRYDNIDLPKALGGVHPGKHNCEKLRDGLNRAGFTALSENATHRMPVVLTEFGWDQQDYDSSFAQCLLHYLAEQQVSWMMWELGGSYYVRQGSQDVDDSWGLLTHDWSTLRAPESVDAFLKPMINTLFANTSEDAANTQVNVFPGSDRLRMGAQPSFLYTFVGVMGAILFIYTFCCRKCIFQNLCNCVLPK